MKGRKSPYWILMFFLFAGKTDILISMHGAGLTHLLFVPKTSGLIELFPQYLTYRPHFYALTKWRQQSYLMWTNSDSRNEYPNFYTEVPVNILLKLVQDMIRLLSEKKRWSHPGFFFVLVTKTEKDVRLAIFSRRKHFVSKKLFWSTVSSIFLRCLKKQLFFQNGNQRFGPKGQGASWRWVAC